jgi:hypothetical protein
MMNKEISLAEAKATLTKCIRDVERGQSVLIKRPGIGQRQFAHSPAFQNIDSTISFQTHED